MKKIFTLICLSGVSLANAQPWNPVSTGMNNLVRAVYNDAASGGLYASGSFTNAGGNLAYYIAYWNGSAWSALGSPANKFGMNTAVNAILNYGGSIYIGGEFTNTMDGSVMCARIARWNGSGWVAVGSPTNGVNNFIYAMAEYNGELYVAGSFTTAGGSAANRIARWNGSNWSAVGSGLDNTVYSMGVYNGDLYVGGSFANAGGSPASRIAKWDGLNWSALGSGTDNIVYDFAGYNSELYVVGTFNNAGGSPASKVARWDGANWNAVGGGLDAANYARALLTYNGILYAAGTFLTAGGTAVNRVAQWNGAAWSAVGDGLSAVVYDLAEFGGVIYAGGFFLTSGANSTPYVARWTPAPLPVELSSFTASAKEDKIVLNWITASETNSDYFAVERKTGEGEGFEEIGIIKASGFSTDPSNYSFTDHSSPTTNYQLPTTVYYRLRQADLDGTGRYSETISVTLQARTPSLSLTLSGNNLRVSFNPAAADASIHVFDMTGNEVMGRELHGLRIGDHSSLLDAGGLNTGIYFLCLRSGGSEMTRRFVIR